MLQGLLGGRLEAGVEVEGLVRDTGGYSGESLVGCQGAHRVRAQECRAANCAQGMYATACVPACCTPCAGSDITLLAKEAAMRPLRRLLAVLEPSVYAGSAAASGALEGGGPLLELGPVTAEDLTAALAVTKSSGKGLEGQYAEFTSRFGQAG